MICLICRRAEIITGLSSVSFERGELHLVTNNVPARICPSCGEVYVDEVVTIQLLHDAEEMSRTGELEVILEYRG
jgi:YgiT-type zinc finger domain-containing protein